jgi:N-carbamoyl-L-amino-acid hydrolase
MLRRKDALVAASRMVEAVNTIGHDFLPDACATVGSMRVYPNPPNVIPGMVFFTVDFRHPDDATLTAMDEALKSVCDEIAAKAGVTVELVNFWHCPPTVFDQRCVEAVREAVAAAGLPAREMVSGAGHDAFHVARAAPTAMVFVPCKDGISHNEAEYATPEACAAGAEVLFGAALRLARQSV